MITSERMATIDRNAEALGIPRKQLMESSGNAVAKTVKDIGNPGDSVAIIAGRGNNGGDGFACARFLSDFEVTVYLLGRPESIRTQITKENWHALQQAEISTHSVTDITNFELGECDVIVDAMLGTGITGELREPERTAAEIINNSNARVVAVDVPSGIDADDESHSPIHVQSDHIVTFHDMKPGLTAYEDITVADIGIPEAAEVFTGPGDLLHLDRPATSHKGDFGRVGIIGGGPYTGAPVLSAKAALRGGADLVYLFLPETISETAQGFSPDLIVRDYKGSYLSSDNISTLREFIDMCDSLVIGPGLGDKRETLDTIAEILTDYTGPAIVDADALSIIPEVSTSANLLCTPHQGELAEMGGPRREQWRERKSAVESFAHEVGHAFVVKGAYDIISNGDQTRVNRTGNPGMTVGGTGDVLAGLAGALISITDPLSAGVMAAYTNGAAGDTAYETYHNSLTATDIIDNIPGILWQNHD
ncbi:MAG: NAD(P)H-hydrate dehydratase [Halobacteriaceae archaeon]